MDFINRLKVEKSELKGKCEKLHAFISDDKFRGASSFQRGKLIEQLSHMANYARCLDERIKDLECE